MCRGWRKCGKSRINWIKFCKKISKMSDFGTRQRAVNLPLELNYSPVIDELSTAKCGEMYLNDHWANKSNKSFWSYWDILVLLFEPVNVVLLLSAVRPGPPLSLYSPCPHWVGSSPTNLFWSQSLCICQSLCLNTWPRSPRSLPIFILTEGGPHPLYPQSHLHPLTVFLSPTILFYIFHSPSWCMK